MVKRRKKEKQPDYATYPWLVARVYDRGLGINLSPINAAPTEKSARALAVRLAGEPLSEGARKGFIAVLKYHKVYAPVQPPIQEAQVPASGSVEGRL